MNYIRELSIYFLNWRYYSQLKPCDKFLHIHTQILPPHSQNIHPLPQLSAFTRSLNLKLLYFKIQFLAMGCTPCNARSICGCKSCADGRRPVRNVEYLEKDGKGQYATGLRGKVKLQVDQADDFLSHHLINEANISKMASSHKIRARQIIQHYMFSEINRAQDFSAVSTSKLTEFALKSWFQRTFLQALERAEIAFLVEKRKYEQVRAQLCEQYIFEVYQMGEFINAGFSRFSTADRHIEVPLSLVLLNSDSALFPLLSDLQNNYPLVTDVPDMKFPEVPKMEQRPNVLKLFNSKCYADPQNLNAQTLMDDLKFIIDQANDLVGDFKSDMQDLLGVQVETDCKVKRKMEPQACYKAEAVRRVFIKWSETLIQKIPDVYTLSQFVDFIRSKKKMAQLFIFKGVVSPTTHHQVIQCLSELLQSLKYKNGTKIPREEFGLFIYDFLRCKTTRNTADEVVSLLQKLLNTKHTKSGKRFEMVRIKNRFKWATRDLLINFRYGQHIIGQAQLCVDHSHESDDTARRIKFRHLLYELERGLFGPTFEMIMLFEDASRKDIQVNMQVEGWVKKRNIYESSTRRIKLANRQCPQNHEMIELVGNIFGVDEKITAVIESANDFNFCDFCFNRFSYAGAYHYCYYCSIFYCTFCYKTYQNTNRKQIHLMGTNHAALKQIESPEHLGNVCAENKSAIVVFYRSDTSASTLFLDQLAYLISAFVSLSKPVPEIYILNVGKKSFQSHLEDWKIDRTPTTVIFNAKMKVQVTIVGATFHDIESLLKVKDRIAKNQPKGLSLKCTQCHSNMVSKEREKSNPQKCQICLDTSKIQDIRDAVNLFLNETSDFICKNGHIRCAYCSYLSSDRPSYYRDFTGRTYLSNKFVTQASICPKDHDMESVSQPSNYKCFNCHRQYKGNQDENISYCERCKVYICIQCEETDTENYKQKQLKSLLLKQMQTVNHFVENRLEESYPCGCGKYFLKVYQSRRLDTNLKIVSALSQFINKGAIAWTCSVCSKVEHKLKLHLACFYCSYAEDKLGKPAHTEICLPCALKAGLIPRSLPQKVIQKQTDLKCFKGHQTVLTSRRQADELSYACSSCTKQCYPYTERYECRTCRIKICKECSEKHLAINPVSTQKRCSNSHTLRCQKTAPKLQFCKVCSVYLQGTHFKCDVAGCGYYLCLKCGSAGTAKK